MKNYPMYVFRMTSLLEKLEIKNAIYVHQDDVREFCEKYWYIQYIQRKTNTLRY